MAEISASGTYVKLWVNVWFDKKANRVHITSQDKDLPKTGMHMSCKVGTQSDTNLRELLDNFGCGPSAKTPAVDPKLTEVLALIDSGTFDANINDLCTAVENRIKT